MNSMDGRLQIVSFQRLPGMQIAHIGGGTTQELPTDTFEVQLFMEADEGITFINSRVRFDMPNADNATVEDIRKAAIKHLKETIR